MAGKSINRFSSPPTSPFTLPLHISLLLISIMCAHNYFDAENDAERLTINLHATQQKSVAPQMIRLLLWTVMHVDYLIMSTHYAFIYAFADKVHQRN